MNNIILTSFNVQDNKFIRELLLASVFEWITINGLIYKNKIFVEISRNKA